MYSAFKPITHFYRLSDLNLTKTLGDIARQSSAWALEMQRLRLEFWLNHFLVMGSWASYLNGFILSFLFFKNGPLHQPPRRTLLIGKREKVH